MPEIDLVSHELKNIINKSEISIQVSLDGFSFCINSDRSNNILALRFYKFSSHISHDGLLDSVNNILRKDSLLKHDFLRSRVIITGRKCTLVPDEFFDSASVKQVFEFNQPLDELDEINYNNIKGLNSKLIFTIPSYIAGMITGKFPGAVFFNQATPLICQSLDSILKEKDQVFIQINHDFFDLVITQNNQLKLYNNYQYRSAIDLTYFLLFACRKLEIDTRNTSLSVCGRYPGAPPLPADLIKAFISVKSIDLPENISNNRIVQKAGVNLYTSLFYLSQCE